MNIDGTEIAIEVLKRTVDPVIRVDWRPLEASGERTMESALECVKRGMAEEIHKRVKKQEKQHGGARGAETSSAIHTMIRMTVNQRLRDNGLEKYQTAGDDLDAYLIEIAEKEETMSAAEDGRDVDKYAKWRRDGGFL